MIAVRLEQPPNAEAPMLVTLSGIVTVDRPMQNWNAPRPKLVTLLAIARFVRLSGPETRSYRCW